MGEEIKIITLGDIFKNIETEEKAFKFKDYIKDLQQKVEQLESIRKEAVEYIKEHARIDDEYPAYIEMLLEEKQDLLNILNKGSEE